VALGDYQAALDDYQSYLECEPEAPDRQAVEETIEWLQSQGE
jgi:regulator of sirC expression with transglutaminase-like and TPR domain